MTADPANVQEGDLVTFTVVVVNSGDQDAPNTEIDLQLPLAAMFVGLTDFDGATIDLPEKTVLGSVELPAGGRRQFQFRVIVPRDAGGLVVRPDLRVRGLGRLPLRKSPRAAAAAAAIRRPIRLFSRSNMRWTGVRW